MPYKGREECEVRNLLAHNSGLAGMEYPFIDSLPRKPPLGDMLPQDWNETPLRDILSRDLPAQDYPIINQINSISDEDAGASE